MDALHRISVKSENLMISAFFWC